MTDKLVDMREKREQGGWICAFEAAGVKFNASLIWLDHYGKFNPATDKIDWIHYKGVEVIVYHGNGVDAEYCGLYEDCYNTDFLLQCVEQFKQDAEDILQRQEEEWEAECERREREREEMAEYENYDI